MGEASQMRHVRVRTNGIDLHCAVGGSGPLLLLLHGFPEFWRSWESQIPRLVGNFTVVAPDLRGFGDSDKPATGYDAVTLALDVVGLMDALGGGGRARVVGHDWGGAIVWALTYLYPDRLDRVSILNAPHPCVLRGKLFSTFQFLRSWYVAFFALPILPNCYLRWRRGAGIKAIFRYASATPGEPPAGYIAAAVAEMLRPGSIQAGLEYYRSAFWLGKRGIEFTNRPTAVPIQMIWGESDPALGVGLLDGVDRYAANLRVHRLPGVGHWVNQEASEAVNDLLLQWLVPERAAKV